MLALVNGSFVNEMTLFGLASPRVPAGSRDSVVSLPGGAINLNLRAKNLGLNYSSLSTIEIIYISDLCYVKSSDCNRAEKPLSYFVHSDSKSAISSSVIANHASKK